MVPPERLDEHGLTWAQTRRRALIVFGALAFLVVVYVIKSALRYRALLAVEAQGGVVSAENAPRWLRSAMGLDSCYAHWTREPPSRLTWFLYEQYALQTDCRVELEPALGDEGLAVLRDLPCTTSLYVGPSVSDAGLRHVGGLGRLERLSLTRTRVVGPGLVHLRGLRRLRRLTLDDTEIDDEGLAHLDDLPALEWLDVRHTRVTSDGLAHLRRFRALKGLRLDGTAVDIGGLRFLAGLPLTWLDLQDTRVTDVGLAALELLPELERLQLQGTAVSDAGLESLKRLPKLREIGLCRTRVDIEAARRSFGPAVESCP